MKRILLLITLCISYDFIAQTVTLYTEDFGTGCNADFQVTSYNPPSGTWSVTNTGSNVATANIWYVSAAENGNAAGQCGSGCGNDRTLHIGSDPTIMGDIGAAYFEGLSGFCGIFGCGATDKRVESPTVNCMGYTNIQLSFLYLEGGNVADNATLWYYNGTNWSQLTDLAKTVGACSPQGTWTLYSTTLPASAENNPNVKIGFRWVNNDNGVASDPSIAVDDIVITGDQDMADVTPPTIECPTELELTCGLIPDLTGEIVATDDLDPAPVVTQNPVAGSGFDGSLDVIEFTATDAAGNSSSCSVPIIYTDAIPPVLTCPDDIVVLTAAGNNFVQISSEVIGTASASDNCGNVVLLSDYTSDIFPVGTTNITWTAEDEFGNLSECIQTVTVETDNPPVLNCPQNQTLSCVALPDFTLNVIVSDDYDPNPELFQTPAAGMIVEQDMEVTITAMDNAGNVTTCTFQVFFDDNEGPTIICPLNMIAIADENGEAIITEEMLGNPVVSDNCGIQDVFNNINMEIYQLGVTPILWTVTDVSGFANACYQYVHVVVDQPPLIGCQGEIAEYAVSAECTPSWSNGCSSQDVLERMVIQAPNNSVIMDTGDTGCNGSPESWIENSTVANLTQGLTYEITVYTAFGFMQSFGAWFDANNDGDFSDAGEFLGASSPTASSFSFPLQVPDYGNLVVQRRLRVVTNFAIAVEESDYCLNSDWGEGEDFLLIMNTEQMSALCGSLPSYLNEVVVYDDFDDSPTLEQSPAPGTFITEDTEVTITATDSNGNTSSCSFMVTYADLIPPTIECPGDLTLNTWDGNCFASLDEFALGEAVVADNCSIANVVNTWSPEAQYPVGLHQIEWSVYDLAGNSAVCYQNIMVIDVTDPVLLCTDTIHVVISEDELSADVTVELPQVIENCEYTLSNDFNNVESASGNYLLGITDVVYSAVDASGNVGECTTTVEVSVQETICCLGDFNCDGFISVSDLIILINEFACLNNCQTDMNSDGLVTTTDLMIFVGLYGGICP
ncbi:MAG: HYR domain-containing protein [Flavobacteriales bacterium]|nr:HYR domain-containing protein [Flavobacteriales bacterium]